MSEAHNLRAGQQPARGKGAAAAAGTDVEDMHLAFAVDSCERQAAIDQVDKIESLEIAPLIGFGIARELRCHARWRPLLVNKNPAIPADFDA